MTNFLVSLLLPIASMTLTNGIDLIIIILVVIIMFSIYKQSNLYYINPALFLFGYKVYEGKVIPVDGKPNEQNTVLILTKNNITVYPRMRKIDFIEVNKNIYFDKKN